MSSGYTKPIKALIDAFRLLPGVGEKTAARYAFAMLKKPEHAQDLSQMLASVPRVTGRCTICHVYAEADPCSTCTDRKRDHTIICVIARDQDYAAFESAHIYSGIYHILGGVLSPMNNIGPEALTIRALIERIEAAGGAIREIILALNSDVEGEATASYLARLLKNQSNLKITRLARGLPTGGELEYADELTLKDALTGRRAV